MGRRGKGGSKPQLNNTKQTAIRPAPTSSMSVIEQMYQQYNPTAFGPNAPLAPYPGMQPKYGPRTYDYPIASNLNLAIRDGFTPFEVLRQFAGIYDGIALCLQGWYDCVANLEPSFEPVPGFLEEDEDITKYASDIAVYEEFFESPDKQLSIHEWMNAALNDMATIDAVCIYPRLTYSGDLYALDLIDGATIKPLIDDRGRVPLPPAYAYEQIDYGVPSGTYTTDQLIYLKEHSRTNSMFGFSRVEAVLMRVNQALRKQNFDLSKFTDGNIPAGWLSPRADIGWTPENLAAYQTLLDNLMAGNDMLRSRVKVAPPGSTYTQTSPMELMTDLDKFLLTVCCGSFGVMLPELGFTETVNRSSGETQEAVTYRRTLRPIAKKFERLFTRILRKYFNEQRFMFRFKGYEEAENFQMLSTSHATLVAGGIETATAAARALKLGDQGPDVPRFIMTATGPFVVDDLANTQLRNLQQQAQMAGLKQATTPEQDDKESDSTSQVAVEQSGGESESDSESSPDSENEDDEGQEDEEKSKEMARMALARADLRKWRDMAISRVKAGKPLRAFVSAHISDGLIERVQQALTDCTTPDEVRLVFAGVGDHQLIGEDGYFFARATQRAWQAPTNEQLAIEATMKQAIMDYFQTLITSEALVQRLLPLYEQAVKLGQDIALKQAKKLERLGPLSGIGNLLGRVRDVVTSVTTFSVAFSGGDTSQGIFDDYATMLSTTEIHATVEQGKLDIYNQYGLPIVWVNESGACPVCVANAEAGVLAAGNAFPSGDDAPPAHPKCRCHLATADGYEPE